MSRAPALRAAAVAGGAALYGLALPPADRPEAAWVTLVPLLLVIRGRTPRAAAAYGALWGLAASGAVTWWLVPAVAHYFRIGLVAAGLAMTAAYVIAVSCVVAPFAATAGWFLRRTPWPVAAPAIAATWVAAELVRARVLLDPWALLGYTQHGQVALIQIASVTGVYGLSFLVALGNAALAEFIARLAGGRSQTAALCAVLPVAALVAGVWLTGAAALGPVEPEVTARAVAVVQANVPPAYEWTRPFAERQLAAHVNATLDLLRHARPALVVWPENALTLYFENEPVIARRLLALTRTAGVDLVFGAPRHAAGRTYNSARLLTSTGRDGGTYDKQRLVPFAEAWPLPAVGSDAPVETPDRFTPGSTPGVLPAFVSAGISICHEILYPDVVEGAVRGGAEVLVNLANDGWLDAGTGIASRQHFAMAALRAVESRRYLVRAASTGISGVIDPYGRVLASQPTGTTGVVTAPVAGRRELTAYVRFGDAFGFGCVLALPLLAATGLRRHAPVPRLQPIPAH